MTQDVETRIAVHEAICAERYSSIDRSLRDITTQSGFPWTITWPDAP